MKHKLFRAHINTYYFGNRSYYVYVLAEDSDEALNYIYKSDDFKNDDEAEIDEIVEIAFETTGVLR